MASSYADDIELAFFVAEFGYTKDDYEKLTKRQIAFIRKAWEDREVRKTSLVNLAINNAMTNMHRKKGKPPVPLFKKHTEQVSVEVLKDSVKRVEDIEKRKGKGWVQKLWAANRKR